MKTFDDIGSEGVGTAVYRISVGGDGGTDGGGSEGDVGRAEVG